jgi:acyl carrier protein
MMRASRFMPKYTRKRYWPAWVALAILAFVPVYFLLNHPVGTSAVLSLLVVMSVVENKRRKARLVALAESRSGESICEFARSFERKEIDTWVVRAVYEQLQRYLGEDPSVPIRATDRLKEDLPIDSEDLELDLMAEIAQRTGRSLDNTIANPYYDKVRTVGDLVLFFNAQPRNATPTS